jgi:hypothetical protein
MSLQIGWYGFIVIDYFASFTFSLNGQFVNAGGALSMVNPTPVNNSRQLQV